MDSPKFEILVSCVEKKHIRAEIDTKSPKNLGKILYDCEDKDFDISTSDGKILKVHLLVKAAQIPIFQ
uniref:Uncharacterized protein n=1 Tax=Panagrolaimus sp. PS1159 TaxID=55785 RepID=A0AC35FF07_9BILA